jgi:cellulose 1,4-beta-cellobiosidase
MRPILVLAFAALAATQQVGTFQRETHPKLSWKRCDETGCKTVNGEVTIDANWRWIHNSSDTQSCFQGQMWNDWVCSSNEECAEICALEGADYVNTYGVKTNGDRISMAYYVPFSFSYNANSRILLMDTETSYETFTLLNNEISFDVNVSSVECGIKTSLYFVGMDADGGSAKFPVNKAGAKYGTGYCDASCPRNNKFNGAEANFENWQPSLQDEFQGAGYQGSCCAEMDVFNSNAHSYSLTSKPCEQVDYQVCEGDWCNYQSSGQSILPVQCDNVGCGYNPYRLGQTDFYGKGKTVDTKKPFTVVTQFRPSGVTQYFIQDGKRIETPGPSYPDFPEQSGLNEDYCQALPYAFNELDRFNQVGGFHKHNEALSRPMVLTLAITDDAWMHNLDLDATWPLDAAGQPGAARGPCSGEDSDPYITRGQWRNARVEWSNIRFGTIGSTVDL